MCATVPYRCSVADLDIVHNFVRYGSGQAPGSSRASPSTCCLRRRVRAGNMPHGCGRRCVGHSEVGPAAYETPTTRGTEPEGGPARAQVCRVGLIVFLAITTTLCRCGGGVTEGSVGAFHVCCNGGWGGVGVQIIQVHDKPHHRELLLSDYLGWFVLLLCFLVSLLLFWGRGRSFKSACLLLRQVSK